MEIETIGGLDGKTLTAGIDRDGARPALILSDEDVAYGIDTEVGPPRLVAAKLRAAAAVLLAVADELDPECAATPATADATRRHDEPAPQDLAVLRALAEDPGLPPDRRTFPVAPANG